jgi:hypothetical protein
VSDGATHYKVYKKIFMPIVLPVSIAITLILISTKINAVLFFVFCFLQYFLARYVDPDNDQPGLTNAEGRMMRTGKGIGRGFTFFGYLSVAYWFMYAWLISLAGGHRSVFSHSLILGTGIRIIYFNIPVALILFLIYKYGNSNWNWQNGSYQLYLDVWAKPYLLSQFIIWSITDGAHLFMDGILFGKRKKK